MTLEAGDEIILKPGFMAENGCGFTAQINPELQGGMAILLTEAPSVVTKKQNLYIKTHNADSWELNVSPQLDLLKNVYQSAGTIRDSATCIWENVNVPPGPYLAKLALKNSYGRRLEVAFPFDITSTANSTSAYSPKSIHSDNDTLIPENAQPATVYPNPSDGVFHIDLGTDTIVNIQVYNSSGHLCYVDENILRSTYNISAQHFTSGTYLAVIRTTGKRHIAKLIKR